MFDPHRFARGWRPGLVAVLAGLSLAKETDVLLSGAVARATAGTPFHALHYWSGLALQIVMLVAAGILIDRFGLRRVVGAALVLWAVFAAATGLAPDAVSVALLRDVDLAAFMGFAAAAALPVATAFPPERRARVLGLLNMVAVGWLVIVPKLGGGWPTAGLGTLAWAIGFTVAAALGLVLAPFWWLASRSAAQALAPERTATANLWTLLRRPGAIGLILVLCCYTQVFFAAERLVLVHLTSERLLATPAVVRIVTVPILVFMIAQVTVAVWSDRRMARFGHPGRARTPFIVAGGVVAASISALPSVGLAGLAPVLALTALGMAMYAMIFVLALDVIPRPLIGRYFGIALAATVMSLALTFVAVPVLSRMLALEPRSLDIFFYGAGAAAFVGAMLAAATLRDLQPLATQASTAEIGSVFA